MPKNEKKGSSLLSDYCQLFVDTGNGFNEKNSIRLPVHIGESEYFFDTKKWKKINALRIDPVDNYALVEFVSVKFDGNEADLSSSEFSGINLKESTTGFHILFDSNDPSIIIPSPPEKIDNIYLKLVISPPMEALEMLYLRTSDKVQYLKNNYEKFRKDFSYKYLKAINGKLNLQSSELEKVKVVLRNVQSMARNDEYFEAIKSDLENFDKHLISGSQQIDTLTSRVEQKTVELKEKDKDLKYLIKKNSELNEAISFIKKELGTHRSLVTKYRKQLSDKKSSISRYKEQLKLIKSDKKKNEKKLEVLLNENKSIYSQIEVLKLEKKNLKDKLIEYSSELEEQNITISKLKSDVEEYVHLQKELDILSKILITK